MSIDIQRWHRRLNGHEFEQILGDGDGQGGLACCSPWDRKESDTTEMQTSVHSCKIMPLHVIISKIPMYLPLYCGQGTKLRNITLKADSLI